MKLAIYLFFTLFGKSLSDTEDLYSSTFQMSVLFKAEIAFVDLLKDYAKTNETYADKVKEFVESVYKDYNSDVIPEKYVAHPLNALGVLKRTAFDYFYMLRPLVDEHYNLTEGLSKLKNATALFEGPFAFADACSGVALLQEAFRLDTKDLVEGKVIAKLPRQDKLETVEGDFKLSWYEMFQIGTMACNRGWFDTGLTWYKFAMERAPKKASSKEEAKKLKEFKTEYKVALKYHDHYLDTRGPVTELSRTFPVPFDEKLRKKKKYKKAKQESPDKVFKIEPLFNDSVSLKSARDNFYLLCKDGEISTRDPALDGKLFCRYQHHSDPYLRLAPFKLEEINQEPFVVLFHEIIYEKEMDKLKARVSSNLVRSEFGGTQKQTGTGLTRTSKQSWVHERYFVIPNGTVSENGELVGENFLLASEILELPTIPAIPYRKYMKVVDNVVFKLSERIGHATRLEVLAPYSSELYQVANYGIGGQYNTHPDARGTRMANEPTEYTPAERNYNYAYGDRIATFMGYIEEVQLGGGTAFPLIGAAVQPVKGSAVFWLNLHPMGHINQLSGHGGCPVLVGSKWITNKWIGSFDQWQHLPCGTQPYDKFDLFNKWRSSSS